MKEVLVLKAYFLKLDMNVYLRAKFGGGEGNFTPALLSQNKPLNEPPRLGLKVVNF